MSSGKPASVSLSALCICSGEPSKKRPQPVPKKNRYRKSASCERLDFPCLERFYLTAKHDAYSGKHGRGITSYAPPMKSVSPVKTALSSPSSNKKQMLSCVWHGVCNAFTRMLLPTLKVSPFAGVLVTLSQSRPPMIGKG